MNQNPDIKIYIQVHCNDHEHNICVATASEEKTLCWRCVPVEEEVDGDSAQVPGGVSVQHPEERREVEELEQRQAMKQHHHHAALPPV